MRTFLPRKDAEFENAEFENAQVDNAQVGIAGSGLNEMEALNGFWRSILYFTHP